MESVRLLHCADLHLGAEVVRLGTRSRARRAEFRRTFHRILELAKEEKVNLLLIAGDLFDVPVVPEELCTEVRDAFAAAYPLQIALCSGNHDPATCDSVYLREDFWPENVTVFASGLAIKEFPELGVRLLGAGFTSTYCSHTLLRRVSLPADDLLNIGIMHGTLVSEGQGSEHNPITLRQIEASGLRYLALGHIHTRKEPAKAGETTYAYPGCTEGRKFGENGPKGVYIADVSRYSCNVRFVPVCERRLECLEVDISEAETLGDVASLVRKAMEKAAGKGYREQIFRVTVKGEQAEGLCFGIEELESALSDVWYLEVQDKTLPFVDEAGFGAGGSIQSVFLKKLAEREENVKASRLEMARKYGLRAFLGPVDIEN